MIKYFDAICLDAYRIAIVEGDTADDISEAPEARDREIERLPDDFSNWKMYTAHGYNHPNLSITVMSRHGD